jgi:hypothetical protein
MITPHVTKRRTSGTRIDAALVRPGVGLDQDQEGLLPGFSFRHSEPIEIRWRRMIPAAKFRV